MKFYAFTVTALCLKALQVLTFLQAIHAQVTTSELSTTLVQNNLRPSYGVASASTVTAEAMCSLSSAGLKWTATNTAYYLQVSFRCTSSSSEITVTSDKCFGDYPTFIIPQLVEPFKTHIIGTELESGTACSFDVTTYNRYATLLDVVSASCTVGSSTTLLPAQCSYLSDTQTCECSCNPDFPDRSSSGLECDPVPTEESSTMLPLTTSLTLSSSTAVLMTPAEVVLSTTARSSVAPTSATVLTRPSIAPSETVLTRPSVAPSETDRPFVTPSKTVLARPSTTPSEARPSVETRPSITPTKSESTTMVSIAPSDSASTFIVTTPMFSTTPSLTSAPTPISVIPSTSTLKYPLLTLLPMVIALIMLTGIIIMLFIIGVVRYKRIRLHKQKTVPFGILKVGEKGTESHSMTKAEVATGPDQQSTTTNCC